MPYVVHHGAGRPLRVTVLGANGTEVLEKFPPHYESASQG